MDSDDDVDLARAIALSVQESERQQRQSKVASGSGSTRPVAREVVVISSDEDEDDVVEVPASALRKADNPNIKKPQEKGAAAAGPLSFLTDRAQMERERLARQKRVRGPSPPASRTSDSDEEEDADAESEGSAPKRPRLAASPPPPTRPTFPTGAFLRIDTQHADSNIDKPACIRLSELIGPKDELAFAILSAFVVDAPWLYEFFASETPVVLVTDVNTSGGEAGDDSPTLKNIFPSWVRVCPPLYNDFGCMHMKFMLLFSKSGALRVVVSSANLVPHDWRHVENYLFVQDLPLAAPGAPRTLTRPGEKSGESFPAMLTRALRAVGVEEALRIMRKQGHTSLALPTLLPSANGAKQSALETHWDWTRVRAALVPSVPGRWQGWAGGDAVVWTGQPRLMRAVQVLGCSLEDLESEKAKRGTKRGKWELELDCLTSSIGTYTPPWLAVFRLCAAGRAGALQAWLDRGRKKTPPQGPTRILFPTLETVRGTVMGEAGAGTIFCRRGQWTKIAALVADTNMGLQMRDAKSRSGGVGMHTKMILGTLRAPPEPEVDPEATESDTESDSSSDIEVLEDDGKGGKGQGKPHAWLYVGSHNFTPSAWGTLSGSGFSPILTVSNYELGVVMRLDTSEEVQRSVAWEQPARRYGKGDVPWIQDESPFFRA
ncbi:tyrosyl-DNA phosphodiesterase-domain-containing protein [Mycena haematopus]|nr:tyrosyl-DNA phosphodiesterase-domain-containing protein [Mycena haematopus]